MARIARDNGAKGGVRNTTHAKGQPQKIRIDIAILSSRPNTASMLLNPFLVQHFHLSTEELPQFGTDDFLFGLLFTLLSLLGNPTTPRPSSSVDCRCGA